MGMRVVKGQDKAHLLIEVQHGEPPETLQWSFLLHPNAVAGVESELAHIAELTKQQKLEEILQGALDSTIEDLKRVVAERDDLSSRLVRAEIEAGLLREDNDDLDRFIDQIDDARSALRTIRELRQSSDD